MPRPQDKDSLLGLGELNFHKIHDLIQSLPEDQRLGTFQFEHRDRCVRDVLAHLHEWHEMMLGWYATGMSGKKPDMPAEGYTWKTLPGLNKEIWKKYQKTTLEEATSLLQSSYKKVRKLIAKHSDEELFEKKRYGWTGSTSLGAYFVSATSSHYDWALKLLKKHKRTYKK